MQSQYAKSQVEVQRLLLERMKSFSDPNERYAFLCTVKHDFEELTNLIAAFEEQGGNEIKINALFARLTVS
jgi:hypothetical protein